MEFAIALILLVLLAVVYEYRFRRPDQLIVFQTRDGVGVRRGRLYARHFGSPITTTAYSFTQTISASARGNLELRVSLAATVAASLQHLHALMRAGGWSAEAVAKAAKELEVVLLGQVRAYTERHDVAEISSEGIRENLRSRVQESRESLGLDMISLTVTACEPTDPEIAEALRRREHARILEQTEALNQQARIATARSRSAADEEIALLEQGLELKRTELRQTQFEKEAALASLRAEHELELKEMQLRHEKHELDLLKENPELLLLTPQAARLAEASQSLRNARTVVSLSGNDLPQGTDLLSLLHTMLENAFERRRTKKKP